MPTLSEKAAQSLNSAKYLVTQHYYSSTVNRSYYACFQYLMYVLFEKLNKNQADFYNEVRQRPNGTHSWASKLVGIELAKKNLDDYKWFQKEIPEFREKRVVADYYSTEINGPEGYLSISKAEAIINLLKKHFK
jgi:uncharacterized protein (UPF0332 family)